ncbi:hypothetical protein FACS1894145_6250 [Bacteroidia bacterium]|nr:hypothetical protein FACS189446_2660 [Bacteroidia bacterium]GHU80240.1 hypothetical protein FACS1894145_6250 [Bacteroidia bacterium]
MAIVKRSVPLPFLYHKIESLPSNLQDEVSLFTDFLLSKISVKEHLEVIPKLGALKGKISLAPDFDEPVDDFKNICNSPQRPF